MRTSQRHLAPFFPDHFELGPALFLSLGPPLLLFASALPQLFLLLSEEIPAGGRVLRLFLKSAELALMVSLSALLLGSAYTLWLSTQSRAFKALGWFLLPIPLLLPKYVLGIAWWSIFDSSGVVGAFLLSLGLRPSTLSLLATPIVLSFACFPIVAIILLLDLESLPPAVLEAAALQNRGPRIWTRAIIPGFYSPLLSAGAFLFCIALTSYSVPAIFQLPVYSTELYSEFSFSGDTSMVSLLALPLFLVGLGCLPLVAQGMKISPKRESVPRSALAITQPQPIWLRTLMYPLLVAALFVPVGTPALLASRAPSPGVLIATIRGAGTDIVYSLAIASSAALLSTLCTLPVARTLLRRPSKTLLALCLLPAVMPAPLYALGVLKLGRLINGSFALVLAQAGRFLPFALITILLVLRRVDPLLLQAAEMAPRHLFFRRLRVTLPLILPSLLASGAVVFSLSLGDLGISVLLAPPGAGIFSLRLFNLLHYGAGDQAAGLALAVIPIVYTVWAAAALLIRRTTSC